MYYVYWAKLMLRQAGLITYMGLLLSPIFREHAAIHQWNIRGKDLQSWVKVRSNLPHFPPLSLTKVFHVDCQWC